jgi:hypothetical protein
VHACRGAATACAGDDKAAAEAAADGSKAGTLAMEEFAEPQCFTTSSFKEAVQGMLSAR